MKKYILTHFGFYGKPRGREAGLSAFGFDDLEIGSKPCIAGGAHQQEVLPSGALHLLGLSAA
jgi:hypothetical protein